MQRANREGFAAGTTRLGMLGEEGLVLPACAFPLLGVLGFKNEDPGTELHFLQMNFKFFLNSSFFF